MLRMRKPAIHGEMSDNQKMFLSGFLVAQSATSVATRMNKPAVHGAMGKKTYRLCDDAITSC